MRGCSDGRSLVFMLNEGNQSKAAYIAIRYRGPDYELIAGGKTDATEVQVAWQWAKGLTRPEIEALYAETQQKKRRA